MNQELILYPAVAMALLTLGVSLLLFRARRQAIFSGEVNPAYFLLNRGGRLPERLIRVEQNYNNLFELPVLFYALVVLLYLSHSGDTVQLALLWGFVLSRIIHSNIHIRHNHLRWRMRSFITGFLLLLAAWLWLLLRLLLGG